MKFLDLARKNHSAKGKIVKDILVPLILSFFGKAVDRPFIPCFRVLFTFTLRYSPKRFSLLLKILMEIRFFATGYES